MTIALKEMVKYIGHVFVWQDKSHLAVYDFNWTIFYFHLKIPLVSAFYILQNPFTLDMISMYLHTF